MNRKHINKRIKNMRNNRDKTKDLYDTINSTIIEENVDYRKVFENAVQYAYGEPLDEYNEKSIDAIIVNDIRHNYSNYDQMLKKVYRINRTDRDYEQYKNSVLEKISNAYPALKDECEKQKRDFDMVKICKKR